MSGGFREGDDDDDFGDLLTTNSTKSTPSYYQSEQSTTTMEDAISTNPFADMESSRVIYDLPPSSTSHEPSGFQSSPPSSAYTRPIIKEEEQSGDEGEDSFVSNLDSRRFIREDAPEPESPMFSSTTHTSYLPDEDLLPPLSPPSSTSNTYAPLSPSEQTPFGSPPPLTSNSTSSTSNIYDSSSSNINNKLDLSALLGEEKPILPSFSRRELNSSTSSNKGSGNLLLPISSIGNKAVGSALATLLGLEADIIDEPVKTVAREPEKEKVEDEEEVIIEEAAPLPPDLTKASLIALLSTPMEALSLELPPSPKIVPTTTREENEPIHSSTATLMTVMESQISHLSLSTPSIITERPLFGTTNSNFSTNSNSTNSNSDNTQRNTTSSLLFGDQSSSTSTSAPNRGFKTFNDESLDPSPDLEQEIEQEQNNADDRASIRGNYSDSLRGERNGDNSSRIGTGANSPTGTLNGIGGESERGEREREGSGSSAVRSESVDSTRRPSLPNKNSPLPNQSPSSTLPASPPPQASSSTFSSSRMATENVTQAPPMRSTELGGSLGPSFIISVGDPQKVGSSLNVASQHTVYTVRTQTTSSAFRKPEFSVLRRFSHFLWLFETLTISNPGVIVPGMPEKNALGRFGSDFVENRRSALQAALMKMVSHPMLVGDPDLRLFLESDSFSVDIKQRRIDTPSENKGFLASLVGSTLSSGPKFTEFDEYFENRKQSLDSFELQLRSLLLSLSSAAKIRTSLQNSIGELQIAFLGLSNCDLSHSLKNALEQGAGVQRKLRLLSEQQSSSEEQIGGIISVAEGYARLCGSVRLVFGARVKAYHAAQAAESVLRKARASQAKRSRGDEMGGSLLEVSEAERKMIDTKRDFEDVCKLTRAEMVRFDKEKVDDFKSAIENHVEGMLLRQREVVATWQLYMEFLTRLSSESRSASSAVAGSNVSAV